MPPAAVIDPSGAWSRRRIEASARTLAVALVAAFEPTGDLDRPAALDDGGTGRLAGVEVGPRVALLCEPGHGFLVALLGCWAAGAVAVPLHPAHPVAELAPLAADAGVAAVVCSAAHRDLAGRVAAGVRVIEVDDHVVAEPTSAGDRDGPSDQTAGLPEDPSDRAALMVFTSGTTGRPKGVVHTHGNVRAQVGALLDPWGWRADDRSLLVLPLHHVHGITAVVLSSWAAGATCEAPGGFEATATWDRFATGGITVFMAVPTVYARLIAAWEAADGTVRRRWSDGARGLRLMVSGSAALPVSVLDRWRALTGHTLLERYGMTEFGLAISNTLTDRVPGHVGRPLPGFEVRRVADDGGPAADREPGELQVRGPAVFPAYWNRAEETVAAFTDDGWFRTGDVGVLEPEGYRLLGRSSVDIIKTGGEKVSAVEIEETYRRHPAVDDGAVVGVPDDEWGQRVALMVVAAPGADPSDLDPAALRRWGRKRLAPAKVPARYLVVDALPRNAMGKVTKPAVVDRFLDAPVDAPVGPSAGSDGDGPVA